MNTIFLYPRLGISLSFVVMDVYFEELDSGGLGMFLLGTFGWKI